MESYSITQPVDIFQSLQETNEKSLNKKMRYESPIRNAGNRNVSNHRITGTPNSSPSKGGWRYICDPKDFDETPRQLKALDKYLLDDDVLFFIKHMFTNVDNTWASQNPVDADDFFSEPYCNLARNKLGYPALGPVL